VALLANSLRGESNNTTLQTIQKPAAGGQTRWWKSILLSYCLNLEDAGAQCGTESWDIRLLLSGTLRILTDWGLLGEELLLTLFHWLNLSSLLRWGQHAPLFSQIPEPYRVIHFKVVIYLNSPSVDFTNIQFRITYGFFLIFGYFSLFWNNSSFIVVKTKRALYSIRHQFNSIRRSHHKIISLPDFICATAPEAQPLRLSSFLTLFLLLCGQSGCLDREDTR
jgi:hypothetical protein